MSSEFPPGQPDPGSQQADTRSVELESPGRRIREARERAQMTLEELAAQTKLARSTLEAIERDDYARLSEPVYAQGYYRKCAAILGLPSEELIAAYRRLAHPDASHAPSKLLLAGESSELVGGSGARISGWWIVLAVVIAIIVVLWLAGRYVRTRPMPEGAPVAAASAGAGQHASVNEAVSTSSTASVAVREVPRSAVPVAPATTVSPPQPESRAAGEAAAAAPATNGTGAGNTTETASAAPAAGGLVLEFKAPSWVHITDSKGKVLLAGTQQPGQQRISDGVPPYALVIGNAHEVSVYYQDRQVAIDAYISPNSTARFSIPVSH